MLEALYSERGLFTSARKAIMNKTKIKFLTLPEARCLSRRCSLCHCKRYQKGISRGPSEQGSSFGHTEIILEQWGLPGSWLPCINENFSRDQPIHKETMWTKTKDAKQETNRWWLLQRLDTHTLCSYRKTAGHQTPPGHTSGGN